MDNEQDHLLALQQGELHSEGERVLTDLQIEPLLSALGIVRFVAASRWG